MRVLLSSGDIMKWLPMPHLLTLSFIVCGAANAFGPKTKQPERSIDLEQIPALYPDTR